MSLDLYLIAGKFCYNDLPIGKEYLRHYFKTESGKAFLNYYLIFSKLYTEHQFIVFYENFCDHTGQAYTTRWVRKLLARLFRVEKALTEADSACDLERLSLIKDGKALLF